MRRALAIIGALMMAMGLVWIGQGLGYVRWPASSFMLDERPSAVRGLSLAVAGLGLLLFARGRR